MKNLIDKITKAFLQSKKDRNNIYSICSNSSGDLSTYCTNEITHVK